MSKITGEKPRPGVGGIPPRQRPTIADRVRIRRPQAKQNVGLEDEGDRLYQKPPVDETEIVAETTETAGNFKGANQHKPPLENADYEAALQGKPGPEVASATALAPAYEPAVNDAAQKLHTIDGAVPEEPTQAFQLQAAGNTAVPPQPQEQAVIASAAARVEQVTHSEVPSINSKEHKRPRNKLNISRNKIPRLATDEKSDPLYRLTDQQRKHAYKVAIIPLRLI